MISLPHFWNELPPAIQARFGQKRAGRQRAMVADGHLLLILHRPSPKGKGEREAQLFWRPPNGMWRTSRGDGVGQLAGLLKEYDTAEDRLSASYETATAAEEYFRLIEQLIPLGRSAHNLHATLQAAREAVPEDRDLIDLRDWAYELERSLDLLHTGAKSALDFLVARQAEEQARLGMHSLKLANRLNLLAAIFFPLMALSSVFGMNLPSGLEGGPAILFWGLFLGGILAGLVISWWAVQDLRRSSPGPPPLIKATTPPAAPPPKRRV